MIDREVLKKYALIFVATVIFFEFCCLWAHKDLYLSFKSVLAGILSFALPQGLFFMLAHRHDRGKNTANLVIYDAIYALTFKYLVLVLFMGFCLKFVWLDKKLYLISFVTAIALRVILTIVKHIRSV